MLSSHYMHAAGVAFSAYFIFSTAELVGAALPTDVIAESRNATSQDRRPHPPHLAYPHGHDHDHDHTHIFQSSAGKQRRNREIPECGTPPMSIEEIQLGQLNTDNIFGSIWDFIVDIWDSIFNPSNPSSPRRVNYNIPTYYHIISTSDGSSPTPTQESIVQQHQILNDAYQPAGFTFDLVEVTRFRNDVWYGYRNFNSNAELEMKTELKRGGADTLNIYVNDALGFCGYAYFPSNYAEFPVWDGVVINDECFVNGPNPVKQGDTLVHEVGHWLGVPHTFENGCNGDGIDDTPDHEEPTYGCPLSAPDTCPQSSGNDPVENYMNYADDGCRYEFTEGQMRRMQAEFATYRAS